MIEYNQFLVDELRARHVLVIYGDAANSAVLDHALLQSARLMAVFVPNAGAAELAMWHGHHTHPGLDISAGDLQQIKRLRRAGAPSGRTGIRRGARSPPPYLHRDAIPEQEPRPLSEAHRDNFYQRTLADPAR